MNKLPHVKHPLFRREELDGSRVADCQQGTAKGFDLSASAPFPDSSYVLELKWTELIRHEKRAGSEIAGTVVQRSLPMDQETVNKIVKPEAGSPLALMGFAFAILQDSESEFLTKAD